MNIALILRKQCEQNIPELCVCVCIKESERVGKRIVEVAHMIVKMDLLYRYQEGVYTMDESTYTHSMSKIIRFLDQP